MKIYYSFITITYPSIYSTYLLPLGVISPGEVLYFPDRWMHATINLDDYNVFVSVFIDVQLLARD
jgi:hypothetical protein